ncbi:MAG TPA: poly-beta-1,6 N-acetyl-D-glucosamine export porin PgaA [Chthoniobacter sp.]|nr:poly-beta-1,6 N-acetyl-D-glucosamine export porin PgaA [Chthoniobacter sp.]
MRRLHSVRVVVAMGVSLSLAAGPLLAAEAITREEAVAMAREGRTDHAITALQELQKTAPEDQLVAYDLAVVYTWVGRSREATDAFEKAADGEPPEYVLGPIIRAYRDQKRFADAERWARATERRYPVDATWAKLLGLILVDEGRSGEARTLLEPWAATQPDDAEIWLALGYAALREGDRFGILRAYGHALRFQPENREAMAAMSGVLVHLGAPTATALYQRPVSIASQASQAGELVRWGHDVSPYDPRRRFEGTDKALARLDQLLAQASAARKPDQGLVTRLRRDRVVALRNRERWREAVRETEALRANGDTIPPYVREAEADALLALRRPRDARRGYEEVLRADPTLREAKIGRFFALIEEEKFSAAFQQADQIVALEKPGMREPKQNGLQPNTEWLEAKVLSVQARSFADMPGVAWKMMLPLAEAAPANAGLRKVLGDVAAGRDWPRRSAEEIAIAVSLAPEDKGVQVSLAESAVRRRAWSEARSRVAELADIFPTDIDVLRLQTDLRAHDAFEFQTEIQVNKEKGGSSDVNETNNSPGSGTDWNARLYTPPLAEYWRFVGTWEHHTAQVTEGRALRYRYGAGVELALPDLSVEAIGWNNEGDISQLGASLALVWEPTDHWRFDLGGEYFAGDTPMRAVLNDITANSASFGVTYKWHESRSLAVGVSGYDFSDGNRRGQAHLTFEQRVVDIPHLDVTLRPEIYTSGNSSSDGPYFSPRRDLSAAITCDAEHILWRHFERIFGHRLTVAGGAYWQEFFDTGWTGSVLYEQFFRYDPWVELRYGVRWNRAVYDGEPTPATEGYIRLNLRF